MTRRSIRLFLCALAASVVPAVACADAMAAPDCFDLRVSARLVRQTPTAIPDCGEDCIIMSWPWILTLDVERVLEGRAPSDTLTVLNVQHTYLRKGRLNRFWLRRNTLGGFNALRLGESGKPERCARGAAPARPFISPAEGQTLEDLEREGDRIYGKGP
jgi:hypothetical protein